MARGASRLLHIYVLALICNVLTEVRGDNTKSEFPSVNSVEIINFKSDADCNAVEFSARGNNIQKHTRIRATQMLSQKNTPCGGGLSDYYKISEVSEERQVEGNPLYALEVPKGVNGDFYLCLLRGSDDEDNGNDDQISAESENNPPKWYHQGPLVKIHVPLDISDGFQNNENVKGSKVSRRKRLVNSSNPVNPDRKPRVTGLRVDSSGHANELDENGVPDLLSNSNHIIRLFGEYFEDDMLITFTAIPGYYEGDCLVAASEGFKVVRDEYNSTTAVVTVNLPANNGPYYVCIKDKPNSAGRASFRHQGTDVYIQLKIHDRMIPLWASIIIICVCLVFSSLFSGLNLGLMSLDRTELRILVNTGTPAERKYAATIQPVRDHGNYLLCSILLGNVFVNNIFTIQLDSLTSGIIAVIFATLAIVIIGEITPQAICSRYGLAVGAKTILVTKMVMILTFPLSYPVSKFLDFILGEEIGNVYTRERLKELVQITTGENDLDKDEVKIISGALELRKKTVADVMTKIEDIYMLDYEAVLNFETVSEIMKTGFSRVPVYEGQKSNVVTVLYIKDLAFVDPDDNTPLKTLCQFYQNPCNFVFEDATLDVMFRIFKEGNKGHMAFVHRVNNEGEGDPFYETIGLVTLEDVIEELIQAEIMDETDIYTDNKSKRKRKAERKQDFSIFAERRGDSKTQISPQLTLAAFQFLSTTVEMFHPNVISETILRRLLKQDVVIHIRKNKDWRTDPHCVIYQQGKAADYFVLILEGRVEVTVGKENLMFVGGPFTFFGTQALVQNIGGVSESPSTNNAAIGSLESLNLDSLLKHTFQPDYTIRASTEVIYIKISRSVYLAAKRATLMERSQKDQSGSDQFDEEVDKLLHAFGDDDVSLGFATPRKRSSKTFQSPQDAAAIQALSHTNSPKSPLYTNNSPPHHVSPKNINMNMSPKDINGAIKGIPPEDAVISNDEDVALIQPKS